MGRLRFTGRDWVKSICLESNVDPGSTKDCYLLTWQNHGDQYVTNAGKMSRNAHKLILSYRPKKK